MVGCHIPKNFNFNVNSNVENKVYTAHAVKADRWVVLHILNLSTGLSWKANLTPQAFYTQDKTSVSFE
jgi:hypothetical protein